MAGGDKFNHKWEKAIIGLLTKPDLATAAEYANISTNTLLRWLNLPDFAQKYSDAKKETLKQALATLQQATGEAVQTLRDVAKDDTAPASSRVSAAKGLIELAFKARETEEVEQRIAALEEEIERLSE